MKRALLNLYRMNMSIRHMLLVVLLTLVGLSLKAQCPPTIIATPATANVCAGDSVLMTCTPSTGTWQWYKDGVIMPGQTNSTCYAYDAGNYSVMVGGCPFPSTSVTVTIRPVPFLAITPSVTTICSGQDVTLSVSTGPNVLWVWVDPNSIFGTNINPLTLTLTATESFQLVGVNQSTNCANTVGVTIQVFPVLVAGNVQSDVEVCPGDTPPLITSAPPTGGSGTYGYQWQSSTTSASNGFTDIPGEISPTFQPGPAFVTTWYRLVISSPPCDDENSNAVVVQVNSNPVVTSPSAKAICTGDNVNYTPISNVPGSTYSWTASLTSGNVSGFSASGIGTINDILTILPLGSSTQGEVTYVITPTGPAPSICPGTPMSLVVTVYPVPLVTNTVLSQDICSGTTTTPVVLQSNITSATFSWTATGTAGLSGYPVSGTGDIPAMNISGLLATTGTVIYTIVPHGPGVTCPNGPSEFYTINVYASPSVTNTTMQETICAGQTTSAVILQSNISGTTFTWTATAFPAAVSGFQASGTNTIPAQTITNSSNIQGVVTYHIIPDKSANGCFGIPGDYIVYVNPEPVASVLQSLVTICSGSTTNIAISSTVAGTTFSWTATAPGSITGYSNGTGSVIAQTLTNTSNVQLDVTYDIIPLSSGCAGKPITVTVTVNPAQVLTVVPATPVVCSGNNIVINLNGNVPGIIFTWTASAVGNVTGFSNGTGSTISQTLTNNDNVTRFVTYSVMMSLNGCNTGPTNFTVTVYPTATITNNPLTATICSGAAFNLALTSGVAGSSYAWTANGTPGISGYSGGSGGTINQSLVNGSNATGTVIYTITPTANGCPGIPSNYTVTVNPVTDVNFSLSSQSICSGTATVPVTFSSSVTGTIYNWTAIPSGGGISGYTASGSASIPAQTISSTLSTQGTVTYTVTPSFNGCNGSASSHIVTVNPLPLVSNPFMSQIICNGGTSAFVNLQSNVAGTTFTWIATPSSPAITGYLASGNNTIPAQTIFNSSLVAGTVTYQVIPTSNFGPNCLGTTANYIINVNPSPAITSSLSEAVCSGQPFSYTITSNLIGSSFTWSRAAVIGISNPTGSGPTTTINETLINTTTSDIDVVYILTPKGQAPTFCAGNPEILTVKVRALPQVNAGIDITIPYGIYTSLSGTATGGSGALTYAWTPNSYISSGANTLTPQTTNLILNRTYSLTVIDAAGCTANDIMTVYVVGTPIAAIPSSTPASICVGGSATINANATGGSGTYTYVWTSIPAGYNSTFPTITVTPLISTQYLLTVNDGFNSANASVTVTVNPLPLQFGLTGGGNYCIGGSGVVVGLAGSQSGVNYQLYNNGNPVGVPVAGTGASISFGNQTLVGIYTASALRVATGCTQAMGSSVSVIINSLPVANAGIDQTIAYGTFTTLIGSVSGGFGSMSYSWTPLAFITSGGNTSSPITTNLYSSTTFTLNITDANGCIGTDQMAVSLSGSAVTVIASATPGQICADTSHAQLNATVTGGAGVYTYSWTCIPAGSPVWTSNIRNPLVTPDVTTTYTVTANDNFNTAIASVTVVVNPLPLQFAVTGGGSYCYGGAGVAIGLSGSELNTNYQLYRGTVADGPAVTGTANPISFGNRTAAFAYTVVATNNVTGCMNQMNGSATVIIVAPPSAYLVTGGGSYPLGGPGRDVGLVHADAGIVYQLYCNNVPVGTPILGTEVALMFGLQTQPGTYTVTGTDLVTGCTADMSGSVDITVLATPIMFDVTGGGTICSGEPGLSISLAGSEAGLDYQLLYNGFPQGPMIAGTNFPLFWGPFTAAGLYDVRAINPVYGTIQMMEDSAVIVVNPLPTVFTVDPTGSQCPGTIIRLNGSDLGVTYYLQMNGFNVDTIQGTGVIAFLDFGPQTMNGTYTVLAVNTVTGCQTMMNGSAFISIAPQVFNVIPAGILCPGQVISLSGSQTGINYQLRRNGTFDLGAPVAGTGSPIIMGTVGLPGIYSVVAIDATTNCVSYMNDSSTLFPDPAAFSIVPDGAACEGDLIGLNGSEIGVDYVLLLDNAIHVDTISGTGFPISFGAQLTAGLYTILAIDQTSYCQFTMNGTTVMNDSPIKYNILPAGLQCIGTTIDLSGSQSGVTYQLMLNGIFNMGLPVAGNGGLISFGPQSLSGTYTIRAVNGLTGCNSIMADSTEIEPLPLVFTTTPAGTHCAGTSIGLNGSELNFNYILVLNGAINIDTIPGTGNPIDFGSQIIAGIYSVVAYNTVSFCNGTMNGNTILEAAPVAFNMTPSGIACKGAVLGLANTETGVDYQLRWNGSTNIGAAVSGTGAAISFGAQSLIGTYSVVATNSDGCVTNMSSTAEISPLPVAFNIIPSGTQCQGTSLGLDGSEVNVNYILILNGMVMTDTIPGTGSSISFGSQLTSGNYSVVAYFTATNCQENMNGISVISNVAPTIYTMTPAGIICAGATIGLDNSEIGASYQLRMNGTVNMGAPVAGTGSAINFGIQNLSGIYTIISTNSFGCNSMMSGNVVVNPNPVAFNTIPAGVFCPGTILGTDGSETGVNYILVLDGAINIDTLSGTGSALSFGIQATSGVYTVVSYNATTLCQTAMNGNTVINPSPIAFNMTPAGIICAGAVLGLDNSETGVSYQLRWNGNTNVGASVAGTGAAISFGIQTLAGTYSVIATGINNCADAMSNTVVVNPLPAVFAITPSGNNCANTPIGLNGSELNTNYVLVLNGAILIDTISGTGSAISFGAQITSGIYTVYAYHSVTNCQIAMNGTSIIVTAPVAYTVTPSGMTCSGAVLGLDNSETGVSYQLRWNGSTNVGASVAGTGAAISFGIQTLAGTYSVIATGINNCAAAMSNTVVVNPLPAVYAITPSGNNCANTPIGLNGSELNTNYVLVLNGAILIDTISGTGSAISFGAQITSGIYTVYAYHSVTGCQIAMNGTSIIVAFPVAYTMTPAGFACSGSAIGLANSEAGTTYQLRWNGSINIGSAVSGTGSAISFGVQSLVGIYTVIATNGNGCFGSMSNSIVVNPLPAVYTVTPAGNNCENTPIGLNGSEININYVLVLNGSILIDTISGTGSTISFGAQTTAGIYTVYAYHSVTSCQIAMNGTSIIVAAPVAYTMIPAGFACQGSVIGLANSEAGTTYQLRWNGSINIGSAVSGTGSAISFGVQSLVGIYTVIATNGNGCFGSMSNSITIDPLPVSFNIVPSGTQCQGTALGLDGSETNVNYVLILDGIILTDTIAGSGSPISFGPQVTAGNYTVVAYYTTTGCQSAMNGASVITTVAPAIFTMTPAGIICAGSSIGLNNSEIGASYQLRRNGTINVGSPVAGTGSAISFGAQTVSGTYTAIATNVNGCNSLMGGNVVVNPNPTAFNLTPSGAQCQGTTLGVDGSESGINYILILNGSINLDTIAGTGSPLSFGPQTTSGTYSVLAFNTATICQTAMNGVTVINPAPVAFNLTPAGIICAGTVLGLDNSETGVTYQLRLNGSINIGTPVAGTGLAITFGSQTLPGTYTVVATNTDNCSAFMNGNLVLNALPIAFNITPSGVQCQGASIGVDGSETGVNYILVLNGTLNIDTIAGNGAAISFGAQLTSGVYTVTAYSAATNCMMVMNGTTTLNSAPSLFNITPAGTICTGAVIGIDGSNTGVNYQLRRNGFINVGSPVAGTGSAISFGVQTVPGTYTVEAAGSNGCTSMMNGSVIMNTTPLVFTQFPAGSHCAGTAITLNGSEIGMDYILFRDGIFATDTLAGTGSALNFGTPMIAGTYTITAVSSAASCQAVMNSSTIILVSPTAFNVTPAGIICAGNVIGLDDSEAGVNYQLRRNGITNVGAPVAGTGSAINFGIINIPGAYTVIATSTSNGCAITMIGNAVLQPLPLIYFLAPTGMHCAGTSITLNGSQAGTDYVLVLDNIFNVDTLAGNGSALDFGPQFVTGTYTIEAIGGATTCQAVMTGSTQIMAYPATFNITPAGLTCASAMVGLDGSETDVDYTLFKNTVNTGITVAGTGSAIIFGIQLYGDYTVKAVNQISGCSIFMPGTLLISIPAQVNAGSDFTICATQTAMLNGTVSLGGSPTWSTSGDGTFDNVSSLTANYTPGTLDIAAGTVDLLLTAYGTGSCASSTVTDTVVVTIDPFATANAGGNIDVCSVSDLTISGASATNYSSVSWTSSGTGTFVNPNILNPTYNPSAADLTAGSVIFTMLVTGNSPCNNAAIGVIVMTFHPMVIVNAGADSSICAGTDFAIPSATASNFLNLTWTTTGTGTFIGASSLTATYSPSAADITAGSVQLILTATSVSPCIAIASDTLVLTLIPAPVSNAGADVSICENTSLNITDASVTNSTSLTWTTSGTGNFSNSSIVNPIYTPTAADIASGSVTLTLTVNGNAICTPVADQKIVTFILNPIVNAGPDAHMCTTPFILSGATSAACASILWTVQTGTGTLINATTLSPTYTASATDIANGFVVLVLTGTAQNPCTGNPTDAVTLIIDQVPVTNAGTDVATCSNSSFIVSDATASQYTNLSWTTSGTGTFDNTTLLNPTYTPSAGDISGGSVTLTLTASNAGCGMVSDAKLISFLNQTAANAGTDITICTGNTATISDASATAYSSIFWTTSGTGIFAGGSTLTPTYTPSVADITNGTVVLTLNAVSIAPCPNVITDQKLVIIQGIPVVTAGSDALICSTSIYNNNDATALNSALLTWSTSGTGTFSNANNLVNTYMPSVADIAAGNVTLTLTSSNNTPCGDASDQKQITFSPAPVVNAGPGSTICTSCMFVATAATVQNSTSIQWSTSGSGLFNNTSLLNTTYTPSPADYAQGSIILSLTAFTNPPCSQVVDTMTLVFSNTPGVGFTWGPACEGQAVAFNVDTTATNVGAIASWLWNFGDGFTSMLMNPTHLFAGIGNKTVTLTAIDTNGFAKVSSHNVIISQLPVSNFSYSTPNCSNQPVDLINLSHTLYGYITEWIWNYNDGSPSDTILFPAQPNVAHQFTAPGIFNVSLTVTNSFGCKSSVTLPVDVIEAPIANFQNSNDCSGLESLFVDASYANGPGNTVQYWWDFGDPSTGMDNFSNLKDATHIFSAPGTYQVMHIVRNFNNCSDTIVKTITILTPVAVDFVYDHTCLDGVANFVPNTTVMNVATITGWAWDFGDGVTNNQQITNHTYATPGSYQVKLTVTDTSGCVASKIRTVVVNPLPVAMFNASTLPCEAAPVHFDDISTTYAGNIIEWNWDFGDGNTQQILLPANPDTDHTYLAAGTYIVKLTIKSSDSCTAERQQTIVISPAPYANFEFENACQGTPVLFSDLTQTGGTGNMSSWSWNFGDDASGSYNTSTIQNPTHTYSTSGTYQVTLTVSTANGCTSTTVKTVIITVAPFVDFSFDNHCVATYIQFTPAAAINIPTVASWNWSFGDGVTSALPNPIHSYNTSGTYNVTLTITNTTGCQSTVSHSISILPAPIANFSTTTPACSQNMVAFTNQSSASAGYIMRWEYNFGDGNTLVVNYPANPSVTHTYTTYGMFVATLTVITSDSCSATTSRNIQILQSPLANFDYDVTCSGIPVQFADLSQGNLISWAWNFGDSGSGSGNTSNQQNPSHTYLQAGNYTVLLLVQNANGCNDTVTRTVSISPKPVVDFSFNNGCAADTVNFISSTFVNVPATTSWLWQFGDNNTSVEADPSHVYTTPGTYSVSLTITNQNGCTNIKTRQVQVTTAPIALFNSNNSSCSGTAVLFTDISSTPNGTISSWNWNFGDGTIVTVNAPANPNVSHIYTASGIYDVVLNIQTSTGCEAFYTSAITINDAPATAFSFEGSCNLIPTTFTDLSQGSGGNMIISWSWVFGDPASGINNTSTLADPQHVFSGTGTYEVSLITENSAGCSSTAVQTIVVSPEPAVDFSLTPSCVGTIVIFSADPAVTNIPEVASYLWDFGDGSALSTLASPEHVYTQAGNYTVMLTIANLTGCENSISHTVTVHALPVAQFTNSGNCVANLVQFTDNSFNPDGELIVGWAWDFGVSTSTNDTSSLQNPSFAYATAGTYNTTLTITSLSGCIDVQVMPVIVIPAPVAQYSYVAEPCHNGSVLFQDESISTQSLITGWYWEFSPGEYSTLKDPVHVFGYTDTCFNVKLVVTTANGCTDTLIREVCIPSGLDVTFTYTQTCIGETTWFIPTLVEPAGGSIAFYNWNFGDPSTGINNESKLANPQHRFSKSGTFVVSLQATDANNCNTTKYITIIVSPMPIAAFSYTGGQCDSLVSFKYLTTSTPISQWIWSYGDGKSDTIDTPASPDVNHNYTFPGEYSVTLIIKSEAGCSDTLVKTIRRTPCITSQFDVNDTLVCQKRTMKFTESSTCQAPIASWQWFFGDNTSATYTTPQAFVEHAYAVAGNYTVKMVVATQMVGGVVTDTASKQVVVKPAAKAAYQWQDVCIGSGTAFDNITQSNNTTISNYNWSFGDPRSSIDSSSLKHPEYQYGESGEYEVKLVVANTMGCTDTIVNTVHIFENPVAEFNWNSSCEARPVQFTDKSDSTSAAIVQYNWIFSNAGEILGASLEPNCSYSFAQAGIYDTELTITDRNGCTSSATKQVAINSSPIAAFSIVDAYENKQGQIMLNNGTINGTNYEWDFGNGTTSYALNPVATFDKEGNYEIQLITWNGQNCADTLKMTYELMYKGLFVPNAFNPGHMDPQVAVFKPKGTNLKSYNIEVVDRWGNILWSSSKLDSKGSPTESWDGKLHGEVLKQDVYLWKISAQFRDGEVWDGSNTGNNTNMPQTKTGTVTLIR